MKNANKFINGVKYDRKAGILMPIFSLPGKYGIGDLGQGAYDFIDMLKDTGQSLWAILPHGQTGYCNSPYKAVSAFAGNPYFISPEILAHNHLLTKKELSSFDFGDKRSSIDYGKLFDNRYKLLHLAFNRWQKQNGSKTPEYQAFQKENNFWLNDYSLYMSLKEHLSFKPWNEWDKPLQNRDAKTLSSYRQKLKNNIKFWKYVQFEYFKQWQTLKAYANSKGIKIIGDMPFYVEYDSVDVWRHKNQFLIDENNEIICSAGVPGDMFSKSSRNWGMPCYNWSEIAKTNYKWHLQRFKQYMSMYDIIRVDHAIGFVRFYGISKNEEKWYKGPDLEEDNIFPKITSLAEKNGCEIIAEDLGSVPERAYYLFDKYKWEGTKILQFGFGNEYGTETIHLPFYYPHKSVAYTGTQDNPTLKSYLQNMDENSLRYLQYYMKNFNDKKENLQLKMIEDLYKSPSEKVIIPIADILEMDNSARIHFGKDYQKSWKWRLPAMSAISANKRKWLKKIAFAYARVPFSEKEAKEYGWC